MKKMIAAIAFFGASATGQAQTPATIIDRAAKTYADMQSVRAEFTQKLTNPLTGTTSTARGVMLRKDPNLLSVNFTDPRGDRVVADGKWLWVYLPSSAPGQVVKVPANSGSQLGMVDPGGLFLTSPSSRFAVTSAGTATVDGHKMNVISLVPKKANSAFTRAKVWVDASDNSVRQFEVTDLNGLTRLVTITKIQPNAKIGASEFKFTPPKNSRILDSSEFSGM